MTLDETVSLSETLMALAVLQQSLEHLTAIGIERRLFLVRMPLALLLVFGIQPLLVEGVLLLLSLATLQRFQGPYNGGSDRMSLLLLMCVFLSHLAPHGRWQEIVVGYLAVQVVLSYTVSGWVKLVNADWRSGLALQDVFAWSMYPVSEQMRTWAESRVWMLSLSWMSMVFEILFPLTLLTGTSLRAALMLAALFHLVNACVFGLNRFLWIWLATYPCVMWLQQRVLI
jgi:uncharacterized membrane protein YjfL (UPF0719 family)